MSIFTGQSHSAAWWRRVVFLLPLGIYVACTETPVAPVPPTLKILSVMPQSASTTGGTPVTVTGTEFTSDSQLTIGGVAASQVVVQGTTIINAVVGPHPESGLADVTLAAGGKTATLASAFTFYAPTGNNEPPVVVSARSVGPRPNQPLGFANQGDTVTLIPNVVNAEGTGGLTYLWTGPGTLAPSSDGTTAWQLPAQVDQAPSALTATLTVTESFAEGAVTHTQKSAPFDFVMQVHDSQKEVLDMGEDFLTLFTKQLPSAQTLHNFSTTCDGGQGRADEADDISTNKANYIEDFSAFRIARRPGFTINFKSFCVAGTQPLQLNTDACSSFSVLWEGTDKRTNLHFITKGIDYVSAVVENNQWKLCHSSFQGTETYPALGITREVSW